MVKLDWEKLLTQKTLVNRSPKGADTDARTAFDSDRDRIIFSSPFRRLQDKAQLFPLEANDYVRTRLTHSLEVASIASSIGISISNEISKKHKDEYNWKESYKNDIPKILECAGLVHDLGNPPFGHAGETYIQNEITRIIEEKQNLCKHLSKQQKKDFECYEGNSQTFRILTHLQNIKDYDGYHLTEALLATIMKYPVSSIRGNQKKSKDIRFHKCGYFYSEQTQAEEVFTNTGLIDTTDEGGAFIRHPLTYLLEAADDIAYCAGDIEDGGRKNVFSIDDIKKELTDYNENVNDKNISDVIEFISKMKESDKYVTQQKCFQDLRIYIHGILIPSVIDAFEENYEKIMTGQFNDELLLVSQAKHLRLCLKQLTSNYLFTNQEIIIKEIFGNTIISNLISKLENGLFNEYDDNGKRYLKFDKRLKSLISQEYLQVFKYNTNCKDDYSGIEINPNNIYYILLLIADQLSGMTDTYCLTMYKKLNAI